eukprot:3667359-Pyramimonas_sp.AAC.3
MASTEMGDHQITHGEVDVSKRSNDKETAFEKPRSCFGQQLVDATRHAYRQSGRYNVCRFLVLTRDVSAKP